MDGRNGKQDSRRRSAPRRKLPQDNRNQILDSRTPESLSRMFPPVNRCQKQDTRTCTQDTRRPETSFRPQTSPSRGTVWDTRIVRDGKTAVRLSHGSVRQDTSGQGLRAGSLRLRDSPLRESNGSLRVPRPGVRFGGPNIRRDDGSVRASHRPRRFSEGRGGTADGRDPEPRMEHGEYARPHPRGIMPNPNTIRQIPGGRGGLRTVRPTFSRTR